MLKNFLFGIALLYALEGAAQQKIEDARQEAIGETVTVSGIVTNGESLGIIRYFQDQTGGLAAYGEQTNGIKRGDSITITGTLKDYNNLLEVDPILDVTVHSSGNSLPSPLLLTPGELGEAYESQMVRINNAEFTEASGTFGSNANYEFISGGQKGVLRINANSPLVGEVIPSGTFHLVAICSQFSYESNDTQTGYQLLPRNISDFIPAGAVRFASPVTVSSITSQSFTLNWQTDTTATTEVHYGTTPDKTDWTGKVTGSSTSSGDVHIHEATISGLNPASIIYAEAFSVTGTDTAFSSVMAYGTRSLSTGTMKVYFNTAVDHSFATGIQAQNIGDAMEDTLIAYIGRAEETIDISVYNINNSGLSNISEALNDAKDRGVTIRFITCGSTNHFGTRPLHTEIPVLERPDVENGGIMHNKFAVFDAHSSDPEKPWVWTGSTNLTADQVNVDANNSIFIQDQTLAKAYQIEFEEMWGSSGDQPSPSNAKFGPDKKDNTPHEFIIGEKRVESYFSPSDGTNQKLIQAMNTADSDLNVETMLITRYDLANAITDAWDRGTAVQVLTDFAQNDYANINSFLSNHLPARKFIIEQNEEKQHHKLAIIDALDASSDPQVITGSHNWSNSANDKNDENTLIIHSHQVANIYFQQFAARFKANGGDLYTPAFSFNQPEISIYPNPVKHHLVIQSPRKIKSLQLFSLSGKKMMDTFLFNASETAMNMKPFLPGMYLLQVTFRNDEQKTFKIIKQ